MTIIIINRLVIWIIQLLSANFLGTQLFFYLSSLRMIQSLAHYINLYNISCGHYSELIYLFNLQFIRDLITMIIVRYNIIFDNFNLFNFKLDILLSHGFDIITKAEKLAAEVQWNNLMIELDRLDRVESLLRMLEEHLATFWM